MPTSDDVLPALGLLERVMLPGSRSCVALTTVSAYGAAREAARDRDHPLIAVFSAVAQPVADPLCAMGVLATVTDLRSVRGLWVADLRAVCLARKQETLRTTPFRIARVTALPAPAEPAGHLLVLAAAVRAAFNALDPASACVAAVREQIAGADPWELPGLVMPLLHQVPWTEWQRVLETDTVEQRLAFVLGHLHARAIC
jgi:hypothetical protein